MFAGLRNPHPRGLGRAVGGAAAWTLLLAVVFGAHAAAPPAPIPIRCELCDGNFSDIIYMVDDPVRQMKRHICDACSKSKVLCSACGLAANAKTLLRLEDGRILCKFDAEGAVLSDIQAQELFSQTKRELQRLLSTWPPLPDQNVQFHLVDLNDFKRYYQLDPFPRHPGELKGLTRSRRKDDKTSEHHIYVLSGSLAPQFQSVCAHEYAHTWLFEHSTEARTLNQDSEEAFCELVAYKHMAALNQPLEQTRILDNGYTRGQIQALAAAEREYQFFRVVDWIHQGVDSWLDVEHLPRLLELKAKKAAPTVTGFLPVVKPPAPDTLVLKGISGSGNKRFALINNHTFALNEEAKVRVGASNLVLRCLEIRANSVLVQIQGEAKPRELHGPPHDRKP